MSLMPLDLAPTPLVQPNFALMMQLRPQLLQNHDDLPPYLLMPEVERLLLRLPNTHAVVLCNLLWQTGARINEALALTFDDLAWLPGGIGMTVKLRTLKQRTGNGNRPRLGRGERGAVREVGIWCPQLCRALEDYRRTFNRPKKQALFVNPRTGKPWSEQMVRNWIKEGCDALVAAGEGLPITVTPHTFRHAFAVNLLIHHIDIVTIQATLGHKSLKSTLVYLQIWKAERYLKLRGVPFRSALPAPDRPSVWGG